MLCLFIFIGRYCGVQLNEKKIEEEKKWLIFEWFVAKKPGKGWQVNCCVGQYIQVIRLFTYVLTYIYIYVCIYLYVGWFVIVGLTLASIHGRITEWNGESIGAERYD